MDIRKERGLLYLRDEEGHRLGEITYVDLNDRWLANHTYVRPDHRNQELALILLNALADTARQEGVKIEPLCSYVVRQFNQDPSFEDVDWRNTKR